MRERYRICTPPWELRPLDRRVIVKKGNDDPFAAKAQYQLADIYLNDVSNYTFAIQEFEKLLNQ